MSFLSFHSVPTLQRLCTGTIAAGYSVRQRRAHGRTCLEADQDTFEAFGIQPAIAASLRTAFPNVQRPTAMQKKLMRAINSNKDVLLQDDTGTGKSFAMMLALLSRPSLRKARQSNDATGGVPTGLLIVPHRDLAYQYLHWIHRMTLREGDTPLSLTKYVQVLVRHVHKSTLQDLPVRMQEAVRSASSDQDPLIYEQPRILIATPNAVLELMERQPELFRRAGPSMVVVDEVDSLLRLPSSKLPKERGRASRKKTEKHVPDLVRVLDRLYHLTSGDRNNTLKGDAVPAYRPQLIMISATLRNRLQSTLFNSYGWVKRRGVLRLFRKRSSALPAHRLCRSAVHHVLVVSKTGDVKNIVGARPLQSSMEDNALSEGLYDDEDGGLYEDADDPELGEDVDMELMHTPLAMDPAMLEAVAATFAVDVPRVALLVLPASAAVRKIIFELRQLGVNAHPFDLAANEASRSHVISRIDPASEENPALIVATLATVRGIDLPDLSHVFILGVPEGRSQGDAYLHVAGRVGRFGRRGKVISVVEEDKARKMATMLSRIGVEVTKLEHLE